MDQYNAAGMDARKMAAECDQNQANCGTVRERTARERLEELQSKCQRTANDLHALSMALPLELPYPADRALRGLIDIALTK